MTERADQTLRTAVAFVTHTRDYRSGELLPALSRHGFTTTERPHDRETERLLSQFQPELTVLAIDPRREADVALIRAVTRSCQSMILVVVPGPHSQGVAGALEAGADVCVRESEGVEVLGAQIGALARRRIIAPPAEDSESTIEVRDLVLDFDRCQVVRDDTKIPLTPTEFKILAHMARHAGKVVSPVEILRAVQDYTYSEREAQEIVKVYIRRIRRKIEEDPSSPSYIINVRGFGYLLERRERDDAARSAKAA